MSKIYTLYHNNCPDGFGSALAAYLKFGDKSEYIGVKHQQDPPEMEPGSEVYILDFSYPRHVMEALLSQHTQIVTLDHHKTAQEALLGLRGALFDMNRSGATISWEYFHPERPIPDLFRYIQDRDLWEWKLEGTGEIAAGLQLLPQEFDLWIDLLTPEGLERLRQDGKTILKYQTKEIQGLLKHVYLDNLPPYQAPTGAWITGAKIPLINCSNYDIVSDLCHQMLEEYPDYPVVASWLRGKSSISYSLRSQPDFDCSEIAKLY
ncbi:hypothetical protein [Chamaesiphon sp.]|uniref:hypothetical protein n=1 Tax=Chamaesiphon sp. TaxID=2814140 RepID=UPI0035931DBE